MFMYKLYTEEIYTENIVVPDKYNIVYVIHTHFLLKANIHFSPHCS